MHAHATFERFKIKFVWKIIQMRGKINVFFIEQHSTRNGKMRTSKKG